MAIGSSLGEYGTENNGNNYGNGKRKIYERDYYTRLAVRSDNLRLGFTFHGGLLIIEIAEQNNNDHSWNALENIYISPTKALILSRELKKFKKYLVNGDITEGKAFGVNAGMNEKTSYIAFSANKDRLITITIGKFDGNGNIIEKASINLNKDYHNGLEWDNIDDMQTLEKVYDDSIELDQITYLLEDFARYMNGAVGYAVADTSRYDLQRILNKMNPIYDKLGIERLSDNNGRGSQGNNFLDNSKSRSTHTTIDSLDDIIGEDD